MERSKNARRTVTSTTEPVALATEDLNIEVVEPPMPSPAPEEDSPKPVSKRRANRANKTSFTAPNAVSTNTLDGKREGEAAEPPASPPAAVKNRKRPASKRHVKISYEAASKAVDVILSEAPADVSEGQVPEPPQPPPISESIRRRLVDALDVYIKANAMLALAHKDKNELRSCVNYVIGGIFLIYGEQDPNEDVCTELLRELKQLFGEAFYVPEHLLEDYQVNPEESYEDQLKRVRERSWPPHISTVTDAANEVMKYCGEALACLREPPSNSSVPCPFFPHGSDDVEAMNSIEGCDYVTFRQVYIDSIVIRIGHSYTINLLHCLKKGDYEQGYKLTMLAMHSPVIILSKTSANRHNTAAVLLAKRWINTLSIFVAGIYSAVGSTTPDNQRRISEFSQFVQSLNETFHTEPTRIDDMWIKQYQLQCRATAVLNCKQVMFSCATFIEAYPDNIADIQSSATRPQRLTIPAIDVFMIAAAAEKVANLYALRGENVVATTTRGPQFEVAIEEMDIARVLYVQALNLLDAVHERSALSCKARILARHVSVCVRQFRALCNLGDVSSRPQLLLDWMTLLYQKIITQLESEKSANPEEEHAYCNCLFALGSAYINFSKHYVEYPQRSVKEKGMECLRYALRANKALIRRNILPDQQYSISRGILSLFDQIIFIETFAVENLECRSSDREALRAVATKHCQFILNLYDHLLVMVSDKEIPPIHKNFTFEICVLHNQLMEMNNVGDNVKIYGCSQALKWLKLMVDVVVVVNNPEMAMKRLLELWGLVGKLLTTMVKKFPNASFVKTSMKCIQKETSDDIQTLCEIIKDSIMEALAVFPEIDIVEELNGFYCA